MCHVCLVLCHLVGSVVERGNYIFVASFQTLLCTIPSIQMTNHFFFIYILGHAKICGEIYTMSSDGWMDYISVLATSLCPTYPASILTIASYVSDL